MNVLAEFLHAAARRDATRRGTRIHVGGRVYTIGGRAYTVGGRADARHPLH